MKHYCSKNYFAIKLKVLKTKPKVFPLILDDKFNQINMFYYYYF